MGKLIPYLVIACLVAASAPALGQQCYQESDLAFFQGVVTLVSGTRDLARGCWDVRLRLRGPATPQGHAMFCGSNACGSPRDPGEGIYWWHGSPRNENIKQVLRKENGHCGDVSFCVMPSDISETLLIDFIALYEEGYFLPPTTFRPRWSSGVIDLSSLDESKSHCQDGDPRGAICL
jgi:hypothetical protein